MVAGAHRAGALSPTPRFISNVSAVPTEPDVSLDLGSQAQRHPEAVAIVMGRSGESLSYREVDGRSNRFARLLRASGMRTGDHVAFLMENNIDYVPLAWGAQRSGLYYTALNNHLRSTEVQYILDDCGATTLVATPAMAEVVSLLDLDRVPTRLVVGGTLPGFEDYASAADAFDPYPVDHESEGREMLYSSGTTGKPKGVRKTLPDTPLGDPTSAPVQIAMGMALAGVGPGSVYLSPAPLYHSAPLVYSMSMLRLGATVVIMENFDAAACLELIERHRVTHAQFVPTMFVRMLKLPRLGAPPVRPLQLALRRPRRRPLSRRRQTPDARRGGAPSSTSTTPAPRTSDRPSSRPRNG